MDTILKLEHVSKLYGDNLVVDNASFEIEKGELVVIVGPSGAGKTTALNLLGGMDLATSGNIFIDGKDITTFTNKRLIKYRRSDIGFVFQFYNWSKGHGKQDYGNCKQY